MFNSVITPLVPILLIDQADRKAAGKNPSVVSWMAIENDRFNIDAEDQSKLQRQAQYFSQYSRVTFTIEGHCDERGDRTNAGNAALTLRLQRGQD